MKARIAKHILTHSACLIALSLSSVAQAITLKEAAMHTLSNHPQVLSAKANELANTFAVKQARGGLYPQVSVLMGYGPERSFNSPVFNAGGNGLTLMRQENTVNFRQLLFDGGRVSGQVMQEESNLENSKYQLVGSEQSMIFQTAQAYLNVLRGRELVVLAVNNVHVHEDTLAQVKLRFRAGAGTSGDIELAQSRLSLAHLRLNSSRGILQQANARFYTLIGMVPPNKILKPKVPKRFLPKTLTRSVYVALHNNPSVNSSKAEVESKARAVQVARASLYPNLHVEVNANHNKNIDGIIGPNRDISALVTMNYNVFRGGSDIAAINRARSEQVQSRHLLQETRRNIIEQTTRDWVQYKTDKQQYKKQRTYVHYAREVVVDFKEQFKLGKRALFNVLDAENELYRARVGLTNAYYDAFIGSYRLLASVGLLTPKVL